MNWYPHHVGDYKAATAHLSNDEDLAYRRLIEMYYDTEQPIPLDTQRVSRRLRMGSDVVEDVLNEFFTKSENGYKHERCDYEIAEFHRKGDIARANGKKGGRRKATPVIENNPAGYQPLTNSLPNANPELTKPLAIQQPRTKNQQPKENTPPDGFNDFWKTFPDKRKGSKGKCLEYWVKHNLEKQKETIYAHMAKMADDWLKDGGQFAPAPMTYLNQKRWDGFEQVETGLGVSYT